MNIIGGALILASSLGISVYLISEGKRRICACEAVCALITFIKQNIEAFGTPIDGILDTCRIDYLDNCAFGEVMRQKGLPSAASEGILTLGKEAQNDFETFAENIGKGYRDEEIKRCDYYLSRFELHLAEERERYERYTPMYRYLPPLGAMSVIIMLL